MRPPRDGLESLKFPSSPVGLSWNGRADPAQEPSEPLDQGGRDGGRIALVNGPLAIRQCADRRRGAYHAVIRAGLDPAAVLTEFPVLAMNTNCGTQAGDEMPTARPGRVHQKLALGLLACPSSRSARCLVGTRHDCG